MVSDGATDSDQVTVTVEPPAASGTMHVGDLDGAARTAGKNWKTKVTIKIHDVSEGLVNGATVTGSWSGGYSGIGSCTTNKKGICAVQTGNVTVGTSSVSFTVDSVTHATLAYQSSGNHDPDTDSDGTVITVPQP